MIKLHGICYLDDLRGRHDREGGIVAKKVKAMTDPRADPKPPNKLSVENSQKSKPIISYWAG